MAGKGKKVMTINRDTFDQFIEIVSLFSQKAAVLMDLYKELVVAHQPHIRFTFSELGTKLEMDPCNLRNYCKALKKEGLLLFAKVEISDRLKSKGPDQYIFSMGPKFEKWLWESNHFKTKKKEYVDNSLSAVDKSSEGGDNNSNSEIQTGGSHLPSNNPQVGATCTKGGSHLSPFSPIHASGPDSGASEIPVFSLSSSLAATPLLSWGKETDQIDRNKKKNRLQMQFMKETKNLGTPEQFIEWERTRA